MEFDKLFKNDRHSLFFFAVVPKDIMRKVIQAQLKFNPQREFLWDEMPHTVYRVLVEMMYSRRSCCMSLEDSDNIDEYIREIGPRMNYGADEEEDRRNRYELLETIHGYICKHRNVLTDASNQLEMILWDRILDGSLGTANEETVGEGGRMRARENGSAIFRVVIVNVMKYL